MNADVIATIQQELLKRGFDMTGNDGDPDTISAHAQALIEDPHPDDPPLTDDDRKLIAALQALL